MTEHDISPAGLRARARDLQLDAVLGEAAGVLPAPDLSDRILAAITTRSQARPRSTRSQRWLAAAIVILSASVVGGIAWLKRADNSSRYVTAPVVVDLEQDPKPAPGKPRGETIIADYSDNRIFGVNGNGQVTFSLDEVFGAWDVEPLPNGDLLITEFSVSRVQRVTREGKLVWKYENLKNPYCAQLLPTGNVLIADTFASRVIEVKPSQDGHGGEIVWTYDKDVRPFDAERLANGNTLIADVMKDRIIEVDKTGKILWQAKNMPNVHDADRLANGHTIAVLRNKGEVVELDKTGKVILRLRKLSSPSDVDMLPHGNFLIAENTRVREVTRKGKTVWQCETTWAVEANRLPPK
ncbi:MAG: PQQ-binding-like beta-propeller repeat protein [bacterium]|nr:PQQ-binding-like beta-propeller repeat protein [bacterium]